MLRRFAPDLPAAKELARLLTLGGLEVTAVRPAAPDCSGVLVGRVTASEPMKGSKKLSLCTVSIAEGKAAKSYQVVCGAANVEVGRCYPFAMPGAVLPGGFEIGERKLAGVLSQGMLCSAAELGLGEDADGIMLLEDLPNKSVAVGKDLPNRSVAVGNDLAQHLGGDDSFLHLDLTPDRADCFGAEGIARDAAALTGTGFAPLPVEEVADAVADKVSVQLEAAEDCPRYCGRVLTGLEEPAGASPLWLREALRGFGLRSIGRVVDATNYVMMELGQPLHAFDLDIVGDTIRVRRAAEGETLRLLDESELQLSAEDLLITSPQEPLALAGVMGGLRSGIGESTSAIVLESAFFAPQRVRASRRRYGMHTDASLRFERGVCPQLQRRAMQRVSQLILQLCGGQAGPITEAVREDASVINSASPQIELSRNWLAAVLGATVQPEVVTDALQRLELSPQETDDGWRVQVPPHRFDLACEEDLIEEIARIVGYDQLPETAPATGSGISSGSESPDERNEALCDFLAARGWRECINYSFLSPEAYGEIFVGQPVDAALTLANPLKDSRSVMRSSLLPGLLETMRHNLDHRQQRLRLFEIGACFVSSAEAPQQQNRLGLLTTGPRHDLSWAQDWRQAADFYDLKGLLQALLQSQHCVLRFADAASCEPPAELAALLGDAISHPGQRAILQVAAPPGPDEEIGEWTVVGAAACLHPQLAERFGATSAVLYAELLPDALPSAQSLRPSFRSFARFPRISRDLSLWVPANYTAERLQQAVRQAGGEELADCRIFDLYSAEGRQSFAISLQWQPADATWTSEQADERVQAILSRLQTEGISLRT